MSENVHNYEGQNADPNAQPEPKNIPFDTEIVSAPENSDQAPQYTDQNRHTKDKIVVSLCKLFQHPSLTDWCIVALTGILAGVGIFQYQIMRTQIATQKIEQRAWVKVSADVSHPESAVSVTLEAPLSVELRIDNIGKTSAHQIQTYTCIAILDRSKSIEQSTITNCTVYTHDSGVIGLLYPTDYRVMSINAIRKGENPVVPQPDEVTGFHADRKYVVAYGRAYYTDVFSETHWTQFCIPIGSKGSMNNEQCAVLSQEGDGADPKNP